MLLVQLLVLCSAVWQAGGRLGMGPPKFEQRVSSATSEPSIPTNVFPDEEYFNREGAWDDKDLKSLLNANKEWAKNIAEKTPGFFAELSRGHAPKILWIGCSDARVPANEIIGEPPGSVFVHRNVANMVISTDVNCMSVLQYAVDVLKVKHIVVCGHYECGGVRAALEPIDHGSPLEGWLRNIKDTYRLHKDELCGIEDLKDRQRRLVELNVEEQCLNIYKSAVVQKSRIETNAQVGKPGSRYTFAEPRVHAFVYEPTKGIARKLPVNFKEYIDDLHHIYELYQAADDKNGSDNNGTVLIRGSNGTNGTLSTYMHDIEEVEQEEDGDA